MLPKVSASLRPSDLDDSRIGLGITKSNGNGSTPWAPAIAINAKSSNQRERLPEGTSLDGLAPMQRKKSIEEALVTTEDSSTWHSIPLAFALLPAIGGLMWRDGNLFITDFMLLLLAAVFLHWLVKFPWDWYHASREVAKVYDPYDIWNGSGGAANLKNGSTPSRRTASSSDEAIVASAKKELQRDEVLALGCCFIGPFLGSWLLHIIRAQLSRPSGGLVSDFNLTIFILAAELRPTAHLVKLMKLRTLHLQSIVHRPPYSSFESLSDRLTGIQAEVRELTLITSRAAERDPDIDALHRAVRRYEKKEALHSAQTENRIMEIDSRLNDVLALAAAATAKQQQQTVFNMLMDFAWAMMSAPLLVMWKVVSLPAKVVETLTGATTRRLLLKQGHVAQQQQSRSRSKGIKAK